VNEKRRKVWVLGALAAVAAPLLVAATAFACANLATIKLGKASGAPGNTVSVKGFNFLIRQDASPVAIRLDSRRGPVLAEVRVDSRGRIQTEFQTPNVRPGNHVILATQTKANGRPAAGTPARHPFRVRGSSGSSSAVPVAWGAPQQGPPPTAGPAPVALIGGGGLALLALSAGGLAVVRISRRSAGLRAARSLSS